MALTATGEKQILMHIGQVDITAAEAIEIGDLVTATGYKANASASRPADFIALQNGVSGGVFQATKVAVIDGMSGGTGAGTLLYLSDTAGDCAEAAGTLVEVVGVELSATQALFAPGSMVSKLLNKYTQTYATAERTHAARTATAIAAADVAAASAATATTIAAAVPAAPPNVDEDGIAAGGFITRAARLTLVTAVLDLRTHAIEMDLDYEALLVDVADIRTKYAAAVTLANELKVDLDALRADQLDTAQFLNGLIDDLQTVGIIG